MQLIPFYSLEPQHATVRSEIDAILTAGFRSNRFILGESLQKFEDEYARFSSVDFCIGVGNGYDALCLALRASGLEEGDEVVVPANTYVATWLALSNMRLRILPVEPDPLTFTIDFNELQERITPKTRAIIPVHLFGHPCDMGSVMSIARNHGLIVIEDNAQAHGATWSGKATGSFGDINATSFYPTKNLGALGDGGAVTTSDISLSMRVKEYRNYGFSEKNVCDAIGINSRLDELQAAVLSVKLRHLEQWNKERVAIAERYLRELEGTGDLLLPFSHGEARHVYHLFVVRSNYRNSLKEFLDAAGIETSIHYPIPPHLQKAYSFLKYGKGSFPLTEMMADTSLSLPIWPGMLPDSVGYICSQIKKFFLR